MHQPEKLTENEYGGTRTPDTQDRNLVLYPTELHTQNQLLRPAYLW